METPETIKQRERIFDAAIRLTCAAMSGNEDFTHSVVRGSVSHDRIATNMVALAKQLAEKAME